MPSNASSPYLQNLQHVYRVTVDFHDETTDALVVGDFVIYNSALPAGGFEELMATVPNQVQGYLDNEPSLANTVARYMYVRDYWVGQFATV